jgi:hypothetical protein
MKIPLRRFLITAHMSVLVAIAPTASFAEDASVAAKVFDVTVLRTLGSVRLVVGMAALAATSVLYTLMVLPFQRDTGIFTEAKEILVVEPANFVFRRPLGEDFSGN